MTRSARPDGKTKSQVNADREWRKRLANWQESADRRVKNFATEPYKALAAAVILQASKDLASDNLEMVLDAAAWLYSTFPLYADGLGIDLASRRILSKIVDKEA